MSTATARVLPFKPAADRNSGGSGYAYALVIFPDASGFAAVPDGNGLAQENCERSEMLVRLGVLLKGLGLAITSLDD
ncbi:hypothetical protein [Sinorhizobium prairiense]|uniref:hypothetical protein n=1 Tax=unclassified Sinorhizobium TaxID=2613772 RepID=UPI0023D8B861|nr:MULTISPECIES: hypothetical protein [unclassified Sinorhizobium]WEJ11575.1 hypothetical protein N0Q90_11145 [Sinorhizobium sp. M103]WEJ16711.1 hypothetical protein N0Q91_09175 [Sinorhizobium sp. K101]WEJ38570.1 hypothetical protein N0R80_11120 [Sinorhizobium sp. C101]